MESITEPDGEQLSYTYNDNDLVTSVTTRAGRVDYEFDPLNRLGKIIRNGLTLADHDYDPAGNLIRTEMGNGVVESRQYDRRNRLKEIETQDPMGQILAKFGYTLDGVGNPVKLEELPNQVIDYSNRE